MASKLFGGTNLSDIARQVKEKAEVSPFDKPAAVKPVLPAAELALRGRGTGSDLERRENVFLADPRRTRPWAHHNRTEAWYTRERCQDLIDSISRDDQQEPALVRRLAGEPNYDYEIIYGMRRRFACEVLGRKLRVRVTEADDARAAILMHVENADRQDITPMERALSFQQLLRGGVFNTLESLGDAMGVGRAQVSKMLKAAGLLEQGSISQLFTDRSAVPVEPAYKLAGLLERPSAKEVILQAARNLAKDNRAGQGRSPAEVLRLLIASLDRSKKFAPVQKQYNVGSAQRVTVTRNARGKVTLAFPQGLQGVEKAEMVRAVEEIWKDLGG